MQQFLASLILCIFLYPTIQGQQLHFESAIPNEGLPQVPNDLLQDSYGFIWIGTTDGLYRYDGHELREFRYTPTDSTSLSNSHVTSLYEDRNGLIWIGTRSGLNNYNPKTETISRYSGNTHTEDIVHDIMEDHKGKIWYGTYEGLWQLDPKTKELFQYLPEVERKQTLSNKLVWSVFEDKQHRIWAGTHQGFTVFKNDDSFNFSPHYGDFTKEAGLSTDRIFDITQQADSTIWLSSYDGIFKVIENGNEFQFQKLTHKKNNPQSLSNNIINELLIEDHTLWAATYAGGLNEIILPKNENEEIRYVHHKNDPTNSSSISLDRIHTLLLDQSGLLWVGTGNGLDKVSKNAHKFQTLTSQPANPKSLSNNIIKSIYIDSFGNLWVGTFDGLNFLSAKNFKNKKFDFEQFKKRSGDPHSISHNNIFGINEDSQGYLWINTAYGLNYIHIPTFLKDKKFDSFNEIHGIPHTFNYNLLEIGNGAYWVATHGGLAKMSFDPKAPPNVKFENYEMDEQRIDALVNSFTLDVVKDKFGNYWIGTFDGVSKYVEKEGRIFFENYKNEPGNNQSLSNNSFRCFFKDSKGRLWIGTRSGLNLVLQNSKDERATFKIFGIKNGLPNDVIHSIQEDTKGHLWVSTNRGLVEFNPDYDEATEKPVLKIYTKNDGLAASSFVFRSSFKDTEGKLYFGASEGLNYFDPENIPTNSYVPPIRFTKLKVLNKVVDPQKNKEAILQQSITCSDEVTLKHWQNIISLEFAALDFNKPENNQYQYKLSGLNNDWVDNGNSNSITFTNLPAGAHTLEIKGTNNDGLWNETPLKLVIKVLPPFWKTWWAYGLYFLTFAGAVYAFIKFRIQQKISKIKAEAKLEKAREEEREVLRKNNAADFHDELGHRFTKISLFLELAERQSDSNHPVKDYLSKIKANAAGLSEGVRDLIWSLDPKKDSMYQTLTRLQEFGDGLFEFSSIHFKTQGMDESMDKMELAPDVRKNILMLFKEAMNNCLKYSAAENAVLKTKIDGPFVYLIFQDDGIGFDRYKIKTGYGLKNMQSRAAKIEADIEINSKPGTGTEIVLRLAL